VKLSSTKAVYGALLANIAIAVVKFIAAVITGSSAMWSEGIHSSIDTGNQILMLLGIRRSRRPPDPEHPFGHGKEVYFWNLLVAVLIFGVGGGISAYEGILHILHPVMIRDARWNYAVLGFALLFEGISLAIGLRAFYSRHHRGHLLRDIVDSKDPTTYTVIAEDGAAVIGIVLAALGVFLSDALRMPVLDGMASVLIGLLLAAVATFLIRECRGLLVGEGVDRRTAAEVRQIANQDRLAESVSRPLTMYIGPEYVLLTMDVRFRASASAAEVAEATERIKSRIRKRFPFFRRIYLEAAEPQTSAGRGHR